MLLITINYFILLRKEAEPLKKNLGHKIKEQRFKNNLSQKELGKKLNVSDKLISKWENDLCVPNIEYLLQMSHIFKIDINELVGEKKSKRNRKKYRFKIRKYCFTKKTNSLSTVK